MSRMIGVIGGISGEILCDRLHERGFQCLLIAGREGESGLEKSDAVIVEELSHHEEILQRIRALGVSEIILGTGHIVAIELAGYSHPTIMRLASSLRIRSVISGNCGSLA